MKIVLLGNFGVNYSSETHHKKSLESLGHTVVPLQEGKDNVMTVFREASTADMFVWVHTHNWETPRSGGDLTMVEVLDALKRMGIPTVTYHLDLWFGLQRQRDLESDDFYKHIQHFFTVDKKMADWFNENTNVKGHYLPAGVFDQECYISDVPSRHSNDIVFVGSKGYHSEWAYRPKLIEWLQNTYGNKFTHVGGDGQIGTTRGDDLNRLYAGSKVVVGDSLCINFDYPYYWSDRLYETTGRGGFVIFPYIEGIDKEFQISDESVGDEGQELVTYKFGDFDDLKTKIDYYLTHDEEREAIRRRGFERTKRDHTYKNRWAHIIKEVFDEQA